MCTFFLDGKAMSIPSLRLILRSRPGPHSFMNTTLVKRMVKISLVGAQMIRLMRHGGTVLLKVSRHIFYGLHKVSDVSLAMQANPSLVAVSFQLTTDLI